LETTCDLLKAKKMAKKLSGHGFDAVKQQKQYEGSKICPKQRRRKMGLSPRWNLLRRFANRTIQMQTTSHHNIAGTVIPLTTWLQVS
jgi:hypothetical protein